jgi:hypothetical protein
MALAPDPMPVADIYQPHHSSHPAAPLPDTPLEQPIAVSLTEN